MPRHRHAAAIGRSVVGRVLGCGAAITKGVIISLGGTLAWALVNWFTSTASRSL
ncbi:hypothetical protein [Streptacidiphilus rugosus]|uniref:hypothetical protein n=1 Tax=Streptacidiphilus rugosus TaxID=405783 RepID=UPI000AB2A76C|nr:hypothetical protein [Streptacidiphilus rugosus]